MNSLKRFNESSTHPIDLRSIEYNCRSYLHGTDYTINEDGSVDVNGSVEISMRHIQSIPLRFRNVFGDFGIAANNLKSLAGAPEFVEGNFYAWNNGLTDLRGCPKEVGGDLYLGSNKLTSLQGLTQKIGGSLSVYNNKLTSLDGCPEMINEDFTCGENPLTNLVGGPEIVNGFYDCSETEIWDFEGIARYIGEDLRCDFNPNLWDPTHLKDCEVKFLSFMDRNSDYVKPELMKVKTPIQELYKIFSPKEDDVEGYEIFRYSLDYSYIKWDKGKPGIIKWKFKEALDEFGLTYPGDKFFAQYKVLK